MKVHLRRIRERLVENGRRLYEAERELFTHWTVLTLILVFIFSVGAIARPLDTRPKTGRSTSANNRRAPTRQSRDAKPAASAKDQIKPDNGPTRQVAGVPDPKPSGEPPADQNAGDTKPPLPPLENTQNLDQTLLQRFVSFRQFIYDTYGQALSIKSGWRSAAEQLQLFRTLPPGYANPPGKSNHEKGQAIDYTPYNPTFNQHLGQFGLKLRYPGKENWHVEIVEPH